MNIKFTVKHGETIAVRNCKKYYQIAILSVFLNSFLERKRRSFGGFLKWWYPTTMGFPTKNDYFGVFWVYHHLRKHPFGVTNRWSLFFRWSLIHQPNDDGWINQDAPFIGEISPWSWPLILTSIPEHPSSFSPASMRRISNYHWCHPLVA